MEHSQLQTYLLSKYFLSWIIKTFWNYLMAKKALKSNALQV